MTLIGKAKPYRRFTLIKRGSKIKNKTFEIRRSRGSGEKDLLNQASSVFRRNDEEIRGKHAVAGGAARRSFGVIVIPR